MRAIYFLLQVSVLSVFSCFFCSTNAFTQEPFAENQNSFLLDSVDELNFDSPAVAQNLGSSLSDSVQSVVPEVQESGAVVEIAEFPESQFDLTQNVDPDISESWQSTANPAKEDERDPQRYFSVLAGGNWLVGDISGFAISAAVGKRHRNRLRTEFEFSHRSNEESVSLGSFYPEISRNDIFVDTDANSLMANAYLDFYNKSRLTPYVGAGIGISFIDIDTSFTAFANDGSVFWQSSRGLDDTVLGYQFIGGVSANLGEATKFVIEYRYFGTNDVDFGLIGGVPYQAHNLLLGLQRNF